MDMKNFKHFKQMMITEAQKSVETMRVEIKKHFMDYPDTVVKAFGYTMQDLYEGDFVCEKELSSATDAEVAKIHKKLGIKDKIKI